MNSIYAVDLLRREAAAEIDRLRAEVERLTNEVNGYKHDTRRLLEGEARLRAKIERLLALLRKFMQGLRLSPSEMDYARAVLAADGIKNLTTALSECDSDCATQRGGDCTCGAQKFRAKFEQ